MEEHKGGTSFGAIVATIGAVLIALGIAWLIALNWSSIPDALKIVILIILTGGSYIAGTMMKIKDYKGIGGSLQVLGGLLYTLSIFLIAQIFSTDASMQGIAILLLLAWAGVLASAYIFDSSPSLIIALVEFLIWIGVQFIAFFEHTRGDPSIGIIALVYLFTGVLLFGLTQLHKSKDHKFANVYRYWTAFYMLLLTYILSFQVLLPALWPSEATTSAGALIFIIIFAIVSIIIAGIGISMAVAKGKISANEILAAIGVVAVYGLLITLATLVSESRYGLFGGGISGGLFLLWIFDNILFIGVILAVIGYGVKNRSSKIVNLGIIFFTIDIITRYIGFIMDFGGQIGFAVVAIFGGVILIFGGWGIERWRKKLMTEVKAPTGHIYT